MSADQSGYVLEMRNITKTFSGVVALDKVNLKVRAGSVHVLVGENGAGKSTLMKILSGEHQIDSGEMYFKCIKRDCQNTQSALAMGISMIHQELSPVLDMTLAENIYLGREPHLADAKDGGLLSMFVDFKRMNDHAQRLFDRLGLDYSPSQKMRELSIAGMQLMEIAKAISRNAALIIMDEPTSAISDAEVVMLFSQIRDLKERGAAIIYITHKMHEIFQIADDITIIRDGKYIDSNKASFYDENSLISLMVGRTISEIFPAKISDIGAVVLEVKNLSRHGVFENIGFEVRSGEVLGFAGLIGAGRTEVVRAIFGLDALDSGTIFLNREQLKIRNPTDAIQHGIAMVTEDRKAEGLVLCRSVQENISLVNLRKFSPGFLIDLELENQAGLKMQKMLNIKAASLETIVGELSGGNQQKIVIAKWLLGDLKVLILDEPTRGIDVGAKSEIHKLMAHFLQQGLAIIMISSELPEILGMSDRIIVMREGKIAGELKRQDASQENVMSLATGGCNVE